MTARELYEYALIELNKLEAPSLLLEDYNYFINKAVQQYINLVYAKQEIDQQSTDDIRVLKATTVQRPEKLSNDVLNVNSMAGLLSGSLHNATYCTTLPSDYLHLLNCVVEFTVQNSGFKCYDVGDKVFFAARRLTSDMFTQILNNAYMQPTYKRPYYFITNLNSPNQDPEGLVNFAAGTKTSLITNPDMDTAIMDAAILAGTSSTENAAAKANYYAKCAEYITAKATYDADPTDSDKKSAYDTAVTNLSNAKAALTIVGNLVDSQNIAGDRLSNASGVRLELRFGPDDTVFKPTNLYIDYIKSPMYIRLTQDQINSTLDYSQVLEFPDYVCFEIANIFVRLIMENSSDPRLQTNMPINNTIFNPLAQAARQSNEK